MFDGVLAEIRRLWNEGRLHVSDEHAVLRLAQRGISMADLGYIIRHGRITERRRRNPTASWRYRIDGHSVDGVPTACVVVIEHETVVLITAYPIREGSP